MLGCPLGREPPVVIEGDWKVWDDATIFSPSAPSWEVGTTGASCGFVQIPCRYSVRLALCDTKVLLNSAVSEARLRISPVGVGWVLS